MLLGSTVQFPDFLYTTETNPNPKTNPDPNPNRQNRKGLEERELNKPLISKLKGQVVQYLSYVIWQRDHDHRAIITRLSRNYHTHEHTYEALRRLITKYYGGLLRSITETYYEVLRRIITKHYGGLLRSITEAYYEALRRLITKHYGGLLLLIKGITSVLHNLY